MSGRERPVACPLCGHRAPPRVETGDGRCYLDCLSCGLIHLHPDHHPAPDDERAHYDTHENDPEDPRYRAFLARLADPLLARLDRGAEGLDYGAGPGPTLSLMLAERGHPTEIWDPFFAADPAALARRYDFVSCTETAEHFHHPRQEFERLDALLRPAGLLAVMTVMYSDDAITGDELATWWYRRDPTHVSFYRRRTFRWIAEWLGWTAELPRPNVALLRKPP